jgi:hypothetical protein
MIPTKAGRSTAKLILSTAAFAPNIRVTDLTSSIPTPDLDKSVVRAGRDSFAKLI